MTYNELTAWLKATHPELKLRGGRTIVLRDGKIRHFIRAYKGEVCSRFVCDEGGEPKQITSAERKHLGNERRGKRRKATKKDHKVAKWNSNPAQMLATKKIKQAQQCEVIIRGKGARDGA